MLAFWLFMVFKSFRVPDPFYIHLKMWKLEICRAWMSTTALHFGAVHKLCRLKIGDFWPPPPLSSFLLSRVYLLNRLWGYPTSLPRWHSLWTAPFLICIEKAMHFFRSRWCAIDQNKWFTRTIKIIEKFSSWIQMKAGILNQ